MEGDVWTGGGRMRKVRRGEFKKEEEEWGGEFRGEGRRVGNEEGWRKKNHCKIMDVQ